MSRGTHRRSPHAPCAIRLHADDHQHATKIALEEVKEDVQKVWATIVAAIKKAIEWVENFVAKLFDNNKKMVDRAQKLKEAAGKVEGEATEKEIKNAGIAGAVHIGGSKSLVLVIGR